MRLVHHQQRDLHAVQEITETLVLQTLHGNHQNLELARSRTGHYIIGLITALGRVDTARRNAMALQETQLVLHQRQQRRHHQRQVRQQHGRQLVTQGFARPRRENGGGRSPSQHGADRLFLAQAKVWVTKDLLEGVVHKAVTPLTAELAQKHSPGIPANRERSQGKKRQDDTQGEGWPRAEVGVF